MALTQNPFLFFILAVFLFTISIPRCPVYAIRQQKQHSHSRVFSLPLHPRNPILKLKNQNYTTLKLSRIADDFARVDYINSRIRHAVSNNYSKNPQTPIVPRATKYVARILVGKPAKEFHLVVDSGSHLNWIKCSSHQENYLVFNPSNSSTYQPLPCTSQQCKALGKTVTTNSNCTSAGSNSTCSYKVKYGFGWSETEGEMATETLSFGSPDSFANVAIGCGLNNWGFSDFDGILGLGWVEIAFPAQIKATSFSYCLVNPDSSSSSTLEFNSAMPADAIVAPLFRNPNFDVLYYVELTGITIGEKQIPVPESVYKVKEDGSGGIVVDSGAMVTFLARKVHVLIRDTFRNYTQHIPAAKDDPPFNTCFNISSGSLSSVNFPGMSFQFSNGKSLPLSLENYLWPVDKSEDGESTVYCFAFLSGNDDGVSIIGSVQQIGMRVTYDLTNKLIGFSPNKC